MRPLKKLSSDVLDDIARQVSEIPPVNSHTVLMSTVSRMGWSPYQGPRGGKGWRNSDTGKVRYTESEPAEKSGEMDRIGQGRYRKRSTPPNPVDLKRKSDQEEYWNDQETEEGSDVAVKMIGSLRSVIESSNSMKPGSLDWESKKYEARKIVEEIFEHSPEMWKMAVRLYSDYFPQTVSKDHVIHGDTHKTWMSAINWSRYEGPRGGKGWKNESTGEIRYQDESPETQRKKGSGNEKGRNKIDAYQQGESNPGAGAKTGKLPDGGRVPRSDVRVPKPGRSPGKNPGDKKPPAKNLSKWVTDKPLKGLPAVVRVKGHGRIRFGPYGPARKAAEDYMKSAGLPYKPPETYAKVDTDRASRIAKEFDSMEHDPKNPETLESYRAMMKETMDQWEAIKKTGLKVRFLKPGMDDPYAATPRLAIMDVHENNHLWVFPTDFGFGVGDEFDPSDNPLLEKPGEIIDGKEVCYNDIFRIVHDYFGHIKEGVGFRADGEENAWRSHSAMYSDLARKAMTTETRGQNSWVNFGPSAEHNKTASGASTIYADQKIGLFPDWAVEEGRGDEPQTEKMSSILSWEKYTTPGGDRGWKNKTTGEVRVQRVNPGVRSRMGTNLDVKISSSGLPPGSTATQRAAEILRRVPDGFVVGGVSGNNFHLAVNVRSHFRALCDAMELLTGRTPETQTTKSLLSITVPVDSLRRVGQDRLPSQFMWERGVDFTDIARYLQGNQPRI